MTDPAPRHDYDQFIADWMARAPADQGERPQERMGFIRTGMELTLRDAGLPADELAREMAHFDTAAMRFLNGTSAPAPTVPAPPQTPSMPDLNEPLGFWRWLGIAWLALNWTTGAAGTLFFLLIPLKNDGGINDRLFYGAPVALALIVFAAAVPFLSNVVRRWRGIGFVLFWLPMILLAYGVAVGPLTLLEGFVKSMGPDFLPLAMPLAAALFAVLALPSLWYAFRRLFTRNKLLVEPGEDAGIHPLVAILAVGFCMLFFTIGAQKIWGWGQGPALVVGLLFTGLFIRLFRDHEIGWLFMPVVALPLGLLAADMPPSNLAALTVVGLALAAGFIALLLNLARLRRRTVLFTSLTTAALALMLVMAPTGPSPALWLNDKLGHPLRPMSDAAMRLYAQAYETELGRAALAALDGYRTGAVEVTLVEYQDFENGIEITVDVRNIGERGIVSVRADLTGDGNVPVNFDPCTRPVLDPMFVSPIWPGDTAREKLIWIFDRGCPADKTAAAAERFRKGVEENGRRIDIPSQVLKTRPVDSAQRFKEDARAWLGL